MKTQKYKKLIHYTSASDFLKDLQKWLASSLHYYQKWNKKIQLYGVKVKPYPHDKFDKLCN